MGSSLFRLAACIHVVTLANQRSLQPEEIADMFPRCRPRMCLHASAREGLHAAWGSCPPGGLVVVTGSLYLVGEVLETVRKDVEKRRRTRR
jgi:folylpolyglutamate synthase/dihydropteroate synthase